MYSEAMASPLLLMLAAAAKPQGRSEWGHRALSPPTLADPFPFLFPFPFPFQEAKPNQKMPVLSRSPLLLAGEPPSLRGGGISRARLTPEHWEHPWACAHPPGRVQWLQAWPEESAEPGDPGEWGVMRVGTPPTRLLKPLVKPLTEDTVISVKTAVGSPVQGPLSSPSPDKTHPGTTS